MKPLFYKDKWKILIEKGLDVEDVRQLSRQVAFSFMDHNFQHENYEGAYIDLLCEMACTDSPEINFVVAGALFGIIVEGLCDDFEDMQTQIYNRVMCQVISFCRSLVKGARINERLDDFGIKSFDDLLNRSEKLRKNNNKLPSPGSVKKILLLSRVTIGADVAITSVVINRLSVFYPDADIVVIGNKKLEQVYGGNSLVRVREVLYGRNSGLIERLETWLDVLNVIDDETALLSSKACILIDPDSRLSQLGILPLMPLKQYFFFNSRSANLFDDHKSIAQLCNQWIDKITGEKGFSYPSVWPFAGFMNKALRFCHGLKKSGVRHIIVMNLGVGGNLRKRIQGDFEKDLILELLKEKNTVVLLDRGFGDEELLRTDLLMRSVSENGYFIDSILFNDLESKNFKSGVIGIYCNIGEIAALIACCDEFIGYDSACQHISAALGVKTLTVFAGSNNMRFVRRWSACGENISTLIHVDTLSSHSSINNGSDLIKRIMNARMNS